RRGDGAGAVPVRGRALPVDRRGSTRRLRAAAGRQPGAGVLRVRDRQRRHDLRPAARGGRADAAAQLRRYRRGLIAGRAGRGDVGAQPPPDPRLNARTRNTRRAAGPSRPRANLATMTRRAFRLPVVLLPLALAACATQATPPPENPTTAPAAPAPP